MAASYWGTWNMHPCDMRGCHVGGFSGAHAGAVCVRAWACVVCACVSVCECV